MLKINVFYSKTMFLNTPRDMKVIKSSNANLFLKVKLKIIVKRIPMVQVFVTTIGNYYELAFICTLEAMDIEKILLGNDYAYENPKGCCDFFEKASDIKARQRKDTRQNWKQ
jgi:hypothetical protein